MPGKKKKLKTQHTLFLLLLYFIRFYRKVKLCTNLILTVGKTTIILYHNDPIPSLINSSDIFVKDLD